jgi:hypothetical protein
VVCERIVETEPYEVAWVGQVDLGSNVVKPSTWIGVDESDEAFEIDLESSHPAVEALDSGEMRITTDPGLWPRLEDDLGVFAVTPLSDKDRNYDILVVGVPAETAFDDIEAIVLDALGWPLSIAINAARTRRIIAADNVVEIVFDEGTAAIPSSTSRCGRTARSNSRVPSSSLMGRSRRL